MNHWIRKFACAIKGVGWAVRTQSSFWVHCFFAAAAIIVGVWLQIESWRWVAIILTIAAVISAELFNTSIELIVKAIHPGQDQTIGRALDISAGAVLIVAIGSVIVGLVTLGPPLVDQLQQMFGW